LTWTKEAEMTDTAIGWFSDEAATFGDRVAGAREAAGMSQKDLAGRLGVKLKTLLAWEDDVLEPRSNRLMQLSGVLNVSIMWLLNGEGDGLATPAREPESFPELDKILDDIRDLRRQMVQGAELLAALERKLLVSLKDDDAG